MRIVFDVNGTLLPATLDTERSAAAADFATLLPLELTLNDYGVIEKVSDLPKRLSMKGEPAGTAAEVGDLTYYAPWGNLAIFVKQFQHATGLVKLGSIEGDLSPLRKAGLVPVTIRRADAD